MTLEDKVYDTSYTPIPAYQTSSSYEGLEHEKVHWTQLMRYNNVEFADIYAKDIDTDAGSTLGYTYPNQKKINLHWNLSDEKQEVVALHEAQHNSSPEKPEAQIRYDTAKLSKQVYGHVQTHEYFFN